MLTIYLCFHKHLISLYYHTCKVKSSVNVWYYSGVWGAESLRSSLNYFWFVLPGQQRNLSSGWLMGSTATQLEMLLTCYVKSKYFEVSQNQIPDECRPSSEFKPLSLIKLAEQQASGWTAWVVPILTKLGSTLSRYKRLTWMLAPVQWNKKNLFQDVFSLRWLLVDWTDKWIKPLSKRGLFSWEGHSMRENWMWSETYHSWVRVLFFVWNCTN